MTIYQSVTPRECAHCPLPVVPDRRGGWMHVGGRGYGCRDDSNVLTGTRATPLARANPGAGFTDSERNFT